MRRVTRAMKKRSNQLEFAQHQRREAAEQLRRGTRLASVIARTGISRGTASRIKDAVESKDSVGLSRLLDPAKNRPGRPRVLSARAELSIVHRMKQLATMGFAQNVHSLKSVAASIARHEGTPFAGGMPSDDWVRGFRSRHRDITLRNAENKDVRKLQAESTEHVTTFKTALEKLQNDHPGIFDDPARIWNMDETEVSGAFGKREKVFGPSKTNHGGFKGVVGTGTGKHLTAVVATSAAGHVLPPFFIFEGVYQMERWFEPLNDSVFTDDHGNPEWYTKADWFPSEAVLVGTNRGSMDMATLPAFIQHFQRHVRKIVPGSQQVCLTLDGHSSRNGHEWLELCDVFHISAVQLPANTTHFLQPNDDSINLEFKQGLRTTRDSMLTRALVDFSDMRLKLMLGIAGYRSVTPDVVKLAYRNVGLWPMDFRFTRILEDRLKEENNSDELPDFRDSVNSVLGSRETVAVKVNRILDLVEERQREEIVPDFFPTGRADLRSSNVGNGTVLDRGQAAVYLSHAEVQARRKAEKEKKELAELEKIRKLEEAAQKKEEAKRAREQKAKIVAARKAERAAAAAKKKQDKRAAIEKKKKEKLHRRIVAAKKDGKIASRSAGASGIDDGASSTHAPFTAERNAADATGNSVALSVDARGADDGTAPKCAPVTAERDAAVTTVDDAQVLHGEDEILPAMPPPRLVPRETVVCSSNTLDNLECVSALLEMNGDPNMSIRFSESYGDQSVIEDGSGCLFSVVRTNPNVPK